MVDAANINLNTALVQLEWLKDSKEVDCFASPEARTKVEGRRPGAARPGPAPSVVLLGRYGRYAVSPQPAVAV